jgi:hypothetical protein
LIKKKIPKLLTTFSPISTSPLLCPPRKTISFAVQ